MEFLFSAILGYVLGSIPFGLVFVYLAGLGDIRKIGSGNIGTTNVLRTGRKDLALLTLICDIGKAGFAALIAQFIFHSPEAGICAGVFGVLGHNFPGWLKFKGGKGISTTAAVMRTFDWRLGLCSFIIFAVVVGITRYVSLGSYLLS